MFIVKLRLSFVFFGKKKKKLNFVKGRRQFASCPKIRKVEKIVFAKYEAVRLHLLG